MFSIALILLVTASTLQSATMTTKNPYMNDYSIKFPEEDGSLMRIQSQKPMMQQLNVLDNKFGEALDVPEFCKNLTYCTRKPANYPEEKFSEMLKDYKIPPLPQFDPLGNRQGDIDLVDDCLSEVTYEPLYLVREKRQEPWRTVIQAPDRGYVQKIRLETCSSTGASCFKPFLPVSGYETQCHQVYNHWEIVVGGIDGKGSETIKAELPVCCSCKYKHISFLTRFNADAAKKSTSNVKV